MLLYGVKKAHSKLLYTLGYRGWEQDVTCIPIALHITDEDDKSKVILLIEKEHFDLLDDKLEVHALDGYSIVDIGDIRRTIIKQNKKL